MPRAFDCDNKLSLVTGTGSRDPFWDYFALFIDATLKAFFILVIDIDVLAVAKPARPLLALLLIFPLWTVGAVRVNRKSWLPYHCKISVDSVFVCEFVEKLPSTLHQGFAAGSGAAGTGCLSAAAPETAGTAAATGGGTAVGVSGVDCLSRSLGLILDCSAFLSSAIVRYRIMFSSSW